MKLGNHINDLLFRYDCVIVPEFGGFIGNYSPARINSNQHRFYPPGKSITFNRHLKNNDGLLANLIAQRKGCSFEEAMRTLNKEVKKIEGRLNNGEKVELHHIGSFRLDNQSNLLFEPVLDSNFLLDSFGLTSFQALPVAEKISEETEAEKEVKVIPIRRKREIGKIVKIAAAAAVLFTMVWVPLKTDLVQKAGLDKYLDKILDNAPATYSKTLDKTLKEANNGPASIDLQEILANSDSPMVWSFLSPEERDLETPPTIKIYSPKKSTSKVVMNFESVGDYQVVGGCFAQKENADKFVARLRKRGFSAAITGMRNNLHVVAYGTFHSKSDAIELLRNIQTTENKQAWLLHK